MFNKIFILTTILIALSSGAFAVDQIIDLYNENPDYVIYDNRYNFGRIGAIAVGDVNADSIADYILAAPRAAFNYQGNTGISYIRFGFSKALGNLGYNESSFDLSSSPTLSFDDTLSMVNYPDAQGRTYAGVQINGEYGGHLFADSVAAGDFNGDGIADIVYGLSERLGPSGNGRIYVEKGHSSFGGTLNWTTERINGRTFTISGRNFGDEFGRVLAFGDINGDGKEELAIGTPKGGENSQGTVDIIYGANFPFYSSQSANYLVCKHTTITGENENDKFGSAIAFGDMNNDGIDDLIVGAPNYDFNASNPDSGAVFIFNGSLTTDTLAQPLPQVINLSDAPADILILNTKEGQGLGSSLCVADIDGNGKDDLFIGAPYSDFGPFTDNGIAYLTYNEMLTSGTAGNLAIMQNIASLTIIGSENNIKLGYSLASGDFNNDGLDDIVFSAPYLSAEGRSMCGRVFMFLGVNSPFYYSGLMIYGNASPQTGDIDITGGYSGDMIGSYLAAGDTDGDGKDDLVVSGDRSNSGAGLRPSAWVVRGQSSFETKKHNFRDSFSTNADPNIWKRYE